MTQKLKWLGGFSTSAGPSWILRLRAPWQIDSSRGAILISSRHFFRWQDIPSRARKPPNIKREILDLFQLALMCEMPFNAFMHACIGGGANILTSVSPPRRSLRVGYIGLQKHSEGLLEVDTDIMGSNTQMRMDRRPKEIALFAGEVV